MKRMLGISFALVACTVLIGCAEGGRFAGLQSCSGDGSVVWWEYPNNAGAYDGINNSAANCGRRG